MANVMPVEKRNQILRLLVEGNGIRPIARMMQTNIRTVLRQLVLAGNHCSQLLEERLHTLNLRHVECDEIWTFVGKKQARLTAEEKAERADIGDVYLWTACDQDSKLIAAHLLGKRSGDNARRFMKQLAGRVEWPNYIKQNAVAYRPDAYAPFIQISSDAFPAYPEAVDLAFGPYAKFGTLTKEYRNALMPYTPSEMVGSLRRPVYAMREEEARSICTSHVERNNLTIRTMMRRFTRLALGFSKKVENLEAAVNLHVAYFNFCWRPETLDGKTPAQAAGITHRPWTFAELMAG